MSIVQSRLPLFTHSMKPALLLPALLALLVGFAKAGDALQAELFTSLKPVYADDFDGDTLDSDHWQVRQGTTWLVKDGILTGGPSPKDYQEKKIAAGDPSHAGLKPVIWLEKVPEKLVVHLRLRYDAGDYHPRFPLIDVGHHVHTLVFGRETTTLVLKKNEKTLKVNTPLLPLNQWADVTIELKKGLLLLRIDGKQTRFEDPLIDMAGQQQIDFKGVDHGGIQIDRVRVFEGVE